MHTFIEHIHIWGFSVIKHDLKNNNLQDYKSEIYIYKTYRHHSGDDLHLNYIEISC